MVVVGCGNGRQKRLARQRSPSALRGGMYPRRVRLVVGVLSLLVLLACQRQNEKNEAEGQAAPRPTESSRTSVAPKEASRDREPTPTTLAETPQSVSVLELGAEPRQTLRYAFKKGLSRNLLMLQKSHIDMKIGSQQLPATDIPAIKTSMRWDVAAVDGDTATISQQILSASIDGNSDDPTVLHMRQVLADFKTIRATSRTDSRGNVLKFEVEAQNANSPQMAQVIDSMKQALSQLTVQLPEEALGVGGRWQVTSHLEQFGLKLTQRATYTVTHLDEKGLRANVALQQSSPPGKVTPPGMPAGATVDLLGLNSNGKGTTSIVFLGAAAESQLDLSLSMKMRAPEGAGVPAGGETIEMTLALGFSIQQAKLR